jgi:hypothetical protein
MSDAKGGPGPLGTHGNSPGIDTGTSARMMHRAPEPHGTEPDFLSEVFYYPVTATGAKLLRKGAQYAFGDAQGRYLLELWLSGAAPAEVTLDDADWGQYMRNEPDLQEQILNKLKTDAWAMRDRLAENAGKLEGDYQSTFHGEVGRTSHTGKAISGGYFTGYQILHGSKKTDTLNDVQVEGRFTAVQKGSDQYARWEKQYTGGSGGHPRDYAVHNKWSAAEPVIIEVGGALSEFQNL